MFQFESLSCMTSCKRVAEWLRSPPLNQQVDLEGLGSIAGHASLTQTSISRYNEYQLRLRLKYRPKIHIYHFDGGDEIDPTMACKISLCLFTF